ncbi:MAG: aldo/keto reductase [Phenylobacterium sp.]|uniref:aldo/keto reductase n=1 Tax=Phenylobacterium sp. TaxID=1871053 RepID=UPI002734A540|nr:aldo/keto reductase [Phenylobacterium sp.]MDP3172876.1 aldo/keto reductase [Phenylobacterium sp.]
MLYRSLGATALVVSEIGFGCASYWGKPQFAEREAIGLVHQAIEAGVTFFDTGASYARGEAEPRLGRALKGRDASRLVIASKAGTRHVGGGRIVRDMSPAGVVASAEASLQRLGLDVLPLLQLHGPAISELDEPLLAALEGLRARGMVRALGVNSFDPAVIEHVLGLAAFDVVMVDYNILRPERAGLVARAAAAGKGVLAGMALGMGHAQFQVLKLRGPQDLWYAARGLGRHREEMRRGARVARLLNVPGMTPAQAALAYVLDDANVACAVVGTTRPGHLAQNVAASGMSLPASVRSATDEALQI